MSTKQAQHSCSSGHHLLIRKIGSIIERDLLDDVYACRAGKGTLYGIRRLEQAIRTCSKNYREPCFVLRLDISGFFMSIDTGILLDRVEALILADYSGSDRGRVIELLRTVILTRPSENCVIRGSLRDWQGLPPSKSLFHSAPGCGLPIGNLTSQVLANAYLSPLDHFIRSELQVQFYGRYVDDLVLVHPNADKLRWARSRIQEYLRTELALTMHPRKVVLQSHSQGVKFLGVVLKPGRTYVGARAKGRCHQVLSEHEHNASFPPTTEQVAAMVAATNSYLGLMRHFQTYRLRRRVLMRLDRRWWAVISATQGYRSVRVRGHGDRGRG